MSTSGSDGLLREPATAVLVVRPDVTRRIDLPGAGPCPRPIDLDRARTGLVELVSLRVYSFAADTVIDGEAEDDEVFIVLMRGAADIDVAQDGAHTGRFPLERAGMRAMYLPPHASYRLSARHACDIAYARVKPRAGALPAPRGFTADKDALAIVGYATAMDLALDTLTAGQQLALDEPAGRAAERFLHVRSDDGGIAMVAGKELHDWDAAVLAARTLATLEAQGTIDILTVSASSR